MNAKERVLSACSFQRPDRIPRVEFFWEYSSQWQAALGPIEQVNDITILVPNEGVFPTSMHQLKSENGYLIEIDRWGRIIRRREGAYFSETLDVPFKTRQGVESLVFDPPDLEQFDQMGELMHILKAYRDWTGDDSILRQNRERLIAMIHELEEGRRSMSWSNLDELAACTLA